MAIQYLEMCFKDVILSFSVFIMKEKRNKDGNSEVLQQFLGQSLHGRPVDGQLLTPQQVSDLVAKHRHQSTSGPTEAGGGHSSRATDPRLGRLIRDTPDNPLSSRVSSVMPVTRQVHSTKADSPVLQGRNGRSSDVSHSNDDSNTGVKQSRGVKDKAVQPSMVPHHEGDYPCSPGSAQFSPHISPVTSPARLKPTKGQEPDRGHTLPTYPYGYQEYGPPLQWPPQLYFGTPAVGAPGFNGHPWLQMPNFQGSPYGHSVHSLAPPHAVPYDPAGGQPKRRENQQDFQPVLPDAPHRMGGPNDSPTHFGQDVDTTQQPDVSRADMIFNCILNEISIYIVI